MPDQINMTRGIKSASLFKLRTWNNRQNKDIELYDQVFQSNLPRCQLHKGQVKAEEGYG